MMYLLKIIGNKEVVMDVRMVAVVVLKNIVKRGLYEGIVGFV